MDKYVDKITGIVNETASKPVNEIKKRLKELKEIFQDEDEQKHVMSRMYNALPLSKRKPLASSFGNTVQIPSNVIASAPVPPPVAVPIAPKVVTVPTVPQVTPGTQAVIAPNYNQLASTAKAAVQSIAALQGQGSFGRRSRRSNVYHVRHGNFFYNKYIERI